MTIRMLMTLFENDSWVHAVVNKSPEIDAEKTSGPVINRLIRCVFVHIPDTVSERIAPLDKQTMNQLVLLAATSDRPIPSARQWLSCPACFQEMLCPSLLIRVVCTR
jgi:hypothetical protein